MKPPSAAARRRLTPILLSQVTGLACGVLGVRLTSHLVAPADFGLFAVFLGLVPLGYAVIYAGLLKYAGRHWREAEQQPALLRALLRAGGRKTWWLLAAALLASPFLGPTLAGSLLVCTVLLGAAQLAQTLLQAAQEHWRDFAMVATGSATRALLPPVVYLLTGLGLPALVLGFSLHALALVAVGLILFRSHLWPDQRTAASAPPAIAGVYAGPLFLAVAVAGWIVLGANRWIFAGFFGAEAAGRFVLGANIAAILPSMLGTVALQFRQPDWFARNPDSPGERLAFARELDRMVATYAVGGLAASVALHFAMPLLIGTLIGERYAAAGGFVLAAGFFTTAVTSGYFYHVGLIAAHREKICAQVDLAGGACFIALGLAAALGGERTFLAWLLLSPAVPWLVHRRMARRGLLSPAAPPAP